MANCKIATSCEPQKSHKKRLESGFYRKYLSGSSILDIGGGDSASIIPNAITVDLDFPGYDGLTLPFSDETQDAIFSSHCLEHVDDPGASIREWFRVLKVGGVLVLIVPHQFLYERKLDLPSRWNPEHMRFYTPGTLISEIENSLDMNTYRIRSLRDNDDGFDYDVGEYMHALGSYEIELVIEKISSHSLVKMGLCELRESLKNNQVDEVVVCGAGEIGLEVLALCKDMNIIVKAITDKKSEAVIDGVKTIMISELSNVYSKNFIIASSVYLNEISKELHVLESRFECEFNIFHV